MFRSFSATFLGIGAISVLAALSLSAQEAPPQNQTNVVSVPPSFTPSTAPIEPADAPEVVVDPASLLPDLPSLRNTKASLIGGTVGKLDRVRDQITVQVFGGGKMTIAFDTRTHMFHDGAEAAASDLHKGDRVYVDTILDGSTVFARNIRWKSSSAAGQSQGVVTSYSAEKNELQVRDALSPQSVKIRITPETRIINGERTSSPSALLPGTLVAVKFGARQGGGEVASEVSVLALPGASFTFGGIVTAVDLRLGILVLVSSTDHKTYEIAIDPSVSGVDDNLRPTADVTVLTRFEGNRYVARSVTVNSRN